MERDLSRMSNDAAKLAEFMTLMDKLWSRFHDTGDLRDFANETIKQSLEAANLWREIKTKVMLLP